MRIRSSAIANRSIASRLAATAASNTNAMNILLAPFAPDQDSHASRRPAAENAGTINSIGSMSR